ncbi:DUF4440 domain-containing protein [Microbacterium marinilacus]|nr:nuclear transport factor 2 family protein [Microbacterium marinilacus]MBY0688696.1 nuclear transport factor 2 family protein [Microbacterium marinilacus]
MSPGPVDDVLALERELQTMSTRRDPARVDMLLAADFHEIGASGRTWDRGEIIASLAEETGSGPIQVHDLAGRVVADGVVLATWISVRGERRALRSSLWRLDEDGRWRLVHHQGTLLRDGDGV